MARPDLHRDLARVEKLAGLLDARFEVGGFKFGYDGLIGLVPGVGDTITTAVGCYPIYVVLKHDLGKGLAARMAANLAVDWLVGTVPLLGDAFDFAFKANKRNAELLMRRHPSARYAATEEPVAAVGAGR